MGNLSSHRANRSWSSIAWIKGLVAVDNRYKTAFNISTPVKEMQYSPSLIYFLKVRRTGNCHLVLSTVTVELDTTVIPPPFRDVFFPRGTTLKDVASILNKIR